MGDVTAISPRIIDAPAEQIAAFLRDYEQRPRILTANYTDFRVEPGPVLAFHFAERQDEHDYRLRVVEGSADPDSPDQIVLREADELSSFVNEWRITPAGASSTVTLSGTWKGAGGIGGFFEKLFAPIGPRHIYSQVLANLAAAL
jgi:Polyketide cyclase / dehydrase and lipid transport